jgi:hypothetical protein
MFFIVFRSAKILHCSLYFSISKTAVRTSRKRGQASAFSDYCACIFRCFGLQRYNKDLELQHVGVKIFEDYANCLWFEAEMGRNGFDLEVGRGGLVRNCKQKSTLFALSLVLSHIA